MSLSGESSDDLALGVTSALYSLEAWSDEDLAGSSVSDESSDDLGFG